jgi:hypothetical protein
LKMDVLGLSDKSFHFKSADCPFGIEGTSKDLCQAIMATDKKAMSTLLGREVGLDIRKAIASGDKECEVVFSVK